MRLISTFLALLARFGCTPCSSLTYGNGSDLPRLVGPPSRFFLGPDLLSLSLLSPPSVPLVWNTARCLLSAGSTSPRLCLMANGSAQGHHLAATTCPHPRRAPNHQGDPLFVLQRSERSSPSTVGKLRGLSGCVIGLQRSQGRTEHGSVFYYILPTSPVLHHVLYRALETTVTLPCFHLSMTLLPPTHLPPDDDTMTHCEWLICCL